MDNHHISSGNSTHTDSYLDSKRLLVWWNRQAKSNPDFAGILPTKDERYVGLLYRQEAEWLHFRRIVPLHRKMNVLELGCGAGRWTFRLAPLVNRAVGVDFSEEMIRLAKERQTSQGVENVEFHVEAAQSTLLNGPFDVIYLSGITSYLTDEQLRQTLQNVEKMIHPEGMLVNRTSVNLKIREVFDDGNYQGIYRIIQEEKDLFAEFGFHLKYQAPSYSRMRIPRLINDNRFFQKLMTQAFHYLPRTSRHLINTFTFMWEKISPRKADSQKRSHDFLIFKRI